MDIFFSNVFVKYEIAFLSVNLIYIAFHILHSLFHSYLRLRNFIGKKKTAEKIIEEQEEKIIREEKAIESGAMPPKDTPDDETEETVLS